MPSKDVGENIRELRTAHPDWKPEQVRAAALSGAREAGNTKVKAVSVLRRRRKK